MRECRPLFHPSAIPVAWTSAGFGVPSSGSAGEPPFAVEDPSRRTSTSSAATGKPARSSSLRNPVRQRPIRARPGPIRLRVTPTGGIPDSGPVPADRGHPADSYVPVRSRCSHPGQQQGRRWPSSNSSWVRRMRRSRVISCLASSTQQMNSLRARGVMSFQASSAVGLAISAMRRSRGSLCTTPPGTRGLLTGPR